MNHADHVSLITGGVSATDGSEGRVWADLGSGEGAFTLALADLLGQGNEIYSVDKDKGALRAQESAMRARFPDVTVHYTAADFSRPLQLPPLDGVVMANSLHYQRNKDAVLQLVRGYLKPAGRLILVEYNADSGNPWVPFPMSYSTWEKVALRNGFNSTRLLATVPSRFLREIYSALSFAP